MRIATAGPGRDPLRPQRPAGLGRGAMLALLVHGGLLLALALGVSWRASEPTGATAELWAAVPEFAAPAVQAPPPPVEKPIAKPEPQPEPEPKVESTAARDAEIAIEKAKKEREREKALEARAEADKKRQQALQEEQRKKLAAAQAEKAESERNEKLRQENLKRMLGQAGATGAPTATGTAARDASPSASYAGKVAARVLPHIFDAEDVPKGTRAEVEVRAAPDGMIIGRRLLKSSGNKNWDEAVLRALERTETLPKDTDGRVPTSFPIIFTR